ncbi:cytochrome c and c1 heme-lyase [Sistotremastrum niveocremeum HHB9708]|uniref:Holocytochrome c-type synthase n=1 Tax=Sistotremastrum niveocremeum HHB9708 TaxID=1314777 RepID=A0A164ZLJ0_9AGAM|nr:cytochrome c and c1 heme-lyase [Sistotremastrum niveocremeum HHB9708]
MGQTASSTPQPPPAQCPVSHASAVETIVSKPAQCPVSHAILDASKPARCPVQHDSTSSLNPLNQMPTLSQTPSSSQQSLLPVDRVTSSIPRPASPETGEPASLWDYPSPQQFYNALVRKGWETPEEHVESMVEIHNFLNERAWDEVIRWEKRVPAPPNSEPLQLARFMGKPGEMSPKARFWLLVGSIFPKKFNSEPPFDRHDWIVRRPWSNEEVRYVIDYYSAPPEPDGSPVFSLDVRPALDSFGSIKQRIGMATEEVWASFREQNATNNRNESQPSRS